MTAAYFMIPVPWLSLHLLPKVGWYRSESALYVHLIPPVTKGREQRVHQEPTNQGKRR